MTALMDPTAASADVSGQQFSTEFRSNQRGIFTAQMEFNPNGTVFVNNEGQEDVFGPYSEAGTSLTFVRARVVSDVTSTYEALYYAIAIDFKQSPLDVIQVLFANTPAKIIGFGIGTDFEILSFNGTENLTPVRSAGGSKRR